MIVQGTVNNSTAIIQLDEDGKEEYVGNVTEKGLLKYLSLSGVDTRGEIKNRPAKYPFTIPFSSSRKRATTGMVVDGKMRIYCKGAPEKVIEQCSYYIGEDGQVMELTQE